MGHVRWDRLKLKNEKDKGIKIEFTNDVAIIADNNSHSTNYILSFTKDLPFDKWFIDSGCSLLVMPNKNCFTTYQC